MSRSSLQYASVAKADDLPFADPPHRGAAGRGLALNPIVLSFLSLAATPLYPTFAIGLFIGNKAQASLCVGNWLKGRKLAGRLAEKFTLRQIANSHLLLGRRLR